LMVVRKIDASIFALVAGSGFTKPFLLVSVSSFYILLYCV